MQEQPKRKGAPFLRKIFFLFILLIILGSIGLWYVNEYIMPTKGKTFAVEYLTKATGRNVTLESLYFNPFRGITLRNLTISDDPKYNRKFLEIKRLYINVLYLPFLQEKKIIIPLIQVDSPNVTLTVDSENKWNFESLAFFNQQQAQPGQYKVIVSGVSISNGDCLFEDRATEPVFSKELKDINFRASISYPLKVKYKLNSRLKIKQDNSIAAQGEYDVLKKGATLNLRVKNIPLSDFQPYYSGLPFKALSGNLNGNFGVDYSPERSMTVNAISTVTTLNLIRDNFTVKGDLDINGKVSLDFKDKNAPLKYSADALLKDVSIKGVPEIDSIDKLNGKIYFDETKLWADSVKGAARGLDCVFAGSLKDYTNPYLDLTAKMELDPAKARGFLPAELKEKLKNYQMAGVVKVSFNVNGPLNKEKTPLAYTLTSELVNCSVKPDFLDKPVTSINGTLVSKADTVTLKEISGVFDGKPYKVNGTITDLKTPAFDLSLSSDELKLDTAFQPLDSTLTFSKFAGRYKNTQFNLAGSVTDFKDPVLNIRGSVNTDINEIKSYLPKENTELLAKLGEGTLSTTFNFNGKWKDPRNWRVDLSKFEGKTDSGKFNLIGSISDFNDPALKIHGSIATDIDQIKKWLPSQNIETLDKMEVTGNVSAKFVFDGKLNDQKTWQIDAVADSPQLTVKKLKFDETHIEYRFKDNFVSMPRISAKPYDGSLTANIAIDYTQENPQYVIELQIADVDINKWKNDTALKDKDLHGLFYTNGQFGGYGKNIETLRGKGDFAIKNGRFWELPVFAGLANILYIPGLSKIVFGEARGTFTVGNKVITTNDTQLVSQQMTLVGDGTMDFDGNLNFHLTAAFDKNLLNVPSALGPLRDLFIDQEGNYLGDIKLDGTTKEPKFKIKPIPIDKIFQNKLLDKIKKGLFGGSSE